MKHIIAIMLILFSVECNAQPCILADNVTASPLPIGGTYQPGQVITFTYTITNYDGLADNTNYLHGISIILGSAWNSATLSPVGTPTNSTNAGSWLWVNSITSSATGFTVNTPGWFYDSSFGGPQDNNPGNNYGDGGTEPIGGWVFQWQITVGNCPPNVNGGDLSVIIENYSDSETGSWGQIGCVLDPNEIFNATIECCPIIVTGNITHN